MQVSFRFSGPAKLLCATHGTLRYSGSCCILFFSDARFCQEAFVFLRSLVAIALSGVRSLPHGFGILERLREVAQAGSAKRTHTVTVRARLWNRIDAKRTQLAAATSAAAHPHTMATSI